MKLDRNLRLCIDYGELNKVTIKNNYPIPRIDSTLERLSKAKYFTTLDATSSFYQVVMDLEDSKKTAFKWINETYLFRRMPFRLCEAPETFQEIMDTILQGEISSFTVAYLDDIIIFSNSIEDHKRHVENVILQLKSSGLALKKRNVLSC